MIGFRKEDGGTLRASLQGLMLSKDHSADPRILPSTTTDHPG